MLTHLFNDLGAWLGAHADVWQPLLTAFCLYALAVFGGKIGMRVALALFALALLFCRSPLVATESPFHERALTNIFMFMTTVSAFAMIVQKNPVYAALDFSLVVLGTAGLFLLQSAPFLAAATIIVYAGAVIVTFLFVIMLAQQTGQAVYDQRYRQPIAGALAGAVLLAALLDVSTRPAITEGKPRPAYVLVVPGHVAGASSFLSQSVGSATGVKGLGRSLYSDYLWAVEIAGTVLLASTVGAILIAGQRKETAA